MSLARPGGNATGLTHFAADLIGKRLEFLKETSPGLARVALLVNPDTEVARLYTNVTDSMAQKLGLSNRTFSARSRDELEPAFDAMAKAGIEAVTINSEGLAYQQREFIANMAIARRLLLSVWSRETLEAGALMSYGADQPAMCRRAAVFVDKILKGAKPADLPVEEPTKIEFLLIRHRQVHCNIRFWHKADIQLSRGNVRLGVKRTGDERLRIGAVQTDP
jgi:putative tryptophan/tyrosine transport system substrate-binding protein